MNESLIDDIFEKYDEFLTMLDQCDIEEDAITFESFVMAAMEEAMTADQAVAKMNGQKLPENKITPAELPGQKEGSKSDTQSADKADANSAVEKGKELGDKLNGIFASLTDQLNGFVRKFSMMLAELKEKKFAEQYKEARQKYVPQGGVKMILYDYNLTELNKGRSNLLHFTRNSTAEIQRGTFGDPMPQNSVFEIEEEAVEPFILKAIQAPSNIKTMKEYHKFVQDKFRGRSKERIVQPNEAVNYEQAALEDVKTIQALIKRDENAAYAEISRIVTALKIVRNNQSLSDEARARAKKYAKRIVRIEKILNAYEEFYYRLRLERVVAARNVLKTLYSI